MAGSSSKSKPPKSSYPKPKPSEVAAETKRAYLPLIKNTYAEYWPTHSILVPSPLTQLAFADRPANIEPPQFCECILNRLYLVWPKQAIHPSLRAEHKTLETHNTAAAKTRPKRYIYDPHIHCIV